MANNYHRHKTRLNKKIRNIIMFFLILLFFIITPIIIFYASGYTYNFSENKIKKTGVLSVDIKPKDAGVYLNNILLKEKIPIKLTGKVPGTYNLKIEKKGYKSWEKDIVISSNQTTYIKDITLIKENLPLKILDEIEDIENIFANTDNENILILTKKESLYEFYNYNTENEKNTSVLRFNSENDIKVDLSSYQNLAYIETLQNQEKIVYIIDLDNPETKINTFNFLENVELEFEWVDNNFNPFYIKTGNIIYKINNENITEFTSSSDKIWYIDDDNNYWYLDEKLFLINKDDKKYLLNDKIEKIIDLNKNRIIAKSDKETIVYKIENENITEKTYLSGTNFYHFDEEWWVSSNWEINAIYEDGGIELINRFGQKISQISLFDEEGVFLIKTESNLITFNPGYFISTSILENAQIKNIITETKKRKLFFFGTIGNQSGIFELNY